MNRFLNIGYAVEVINGRLNGSAADVESRKNNNGNRTFVKKINGKGTVSAQCQKYNIQRFMEEVDGYKRNVKTFEGKAEDGSKKSNITITPNPHKYASDDIFGFMMAVATTKISKEEYDLLPEEEKYLFEEKGKGSKVSYEKIGSGTSKRRSNFMMSHLTNVSNSIINDEWNVSGADGGTLPYITETYSGVFSGISNININNIGEYIISDEGQFRDYGSKYAEVLGVQDLSKEEKFNRIKSALKGLEFLSIQGNQNNYLTDTKPKLVLLGEYKWGNNVFQGLIKKDGLDIDMLIETLEQNEEFRISDVWIGINKFHNDNFNSIKEELQERLKDFEFVKVGNVKESFNGYLEFLKETI